MASKTGPRALGSDGSDFMHRERVASHYKASATNKSRLKVFIFLHLLLWVFMVFRLSTSLFVTLGFRPPAYLQRLRLPKSQLWEYVWLVTILPCLFGLFALRKNRIFLMQQYVLGIFVFGFCSTAFTLYDMYDDMKHYWKTKTTDQYILGYPLIVVWYIFLVIAVQLHTYSLYIGYQLLKAWKAALARKKL